jgi:magnesium transporter
MSLARLIGPELATLVREQEWTVIRELVEGDDIHPEDFADVISLLDEHEASLALQELPTEYAARVFERLEENEQASLASHMGMETIAPIATEMDVDDLADFVGNLPQENEAALLEHIERVDPDVVIEVAELQQWPETSAGGLMTTEFISVHPEMSIGEAVATLRKNAQEAETLDTLWVVDEQEKAQGFLTLRDLLLAKQETLVADAMRHRIISVPPELDQEEVAHLFAKYDFHTLPVIDSDNTLLGVITSDDILDVVEEEQDEDVQKMGAIAPIEMGYFEASAVKHFKKRIPWLMVLFLGGFLTASTMEAYRGVIDAVALLAVYVPLLISAGGNSGAQSSTLVIRGLAVGDITVRDWWRVFFREMALGVTLGVVLAALGVVKVLLSSQGIDMAALVAVTIVGIVLLGCVIGGMMPLVLHRIGVDPASSSTPFIATLVDVLGIVVYLGLARWLLADVLARVSGS